MEYNFSQKFLITFFFLLSLYFYHNSYQITESSVWCENKSCRFKNTCYDPNHKSFLFFLNEKSVIKGIDRYDDLQKIQLSSFGHNRFFANITTIHPSNYNSREKIEMIKKAIVISRFKPDNVMHCIHDDLFPLFLTLEKNCLGDLKNCLKEFVILVHDNHGKGKYFELYEFFSQILFLPDHDSLLCFEELITGLSHDSLFFQYGFDQPHGPSKPKITQNDVLRFTSFVQKNIKKNYEKSDIIFLSREKTRKILNKHQVVSTVQNFHQKIFRVKNSSVITVDLNSNSTKCLIDKISKADLLVGMHGAEMILGMFMKPKSIMIELFPFGIRDDISFLKSLTSIEGNEQVYISWRNFVKNNSVPHPDAHPLLGGINHLPESMQKKIKNINEVPPVKCCDDPTYLYHMFQDTFVGNDFEQILEKQSNNLKFKNDDDFFVRKWFFPSSVSELKCKYDDGKKILLISWRPPFNVKDGIIYSIFIAGENMIFKKEIETRETVLKFEIDSDEKKFKLWILANFLGTKSVDQLYECG